MSNAVISLFSGAMGLDLGLEAAGFETVVAVELNKAAVETIRLNKPELPVLAEKIENVPSRTLLEKGDLRRREAAVVIGGPCCQSFSTVGKRGSIADGSGGLFREFVRVVKDVRPRFFVMENVKGILSAAVAHRPLDRRGAGWPPLTKEEQLGSALAVIRREIARLNYRVIFALLNCADYGVPQKRLRVVFIGSRDGENIEMPTPTHFSNEKPYWLTLREALAGVDSSNPICLNFSDQRRRLLARLGPGQNWKDLPQHLHRQALGAAFDSWGGRSGFCRRLAWDAPAPTLTTAPDGRATTLCHPVELRPLSVAEYCAIQQFPPGWKLYGSISQQYIQIGNAVPVGLGKAIGKAIRRTMAQTARYGLPGNAKRAKGTVICADPALEDWLANRKRTQLHPPRLRKIADTEANRAWCAAAA